ncbi:Right handed beta helix region [Desulfatibacillum alkenivorans DSM 16219]|jgi:hypothetical protein|uniref:Right handed beta helix region n=1 Tax=Desulfatibacillum alkenivorans DSM 16219 TaxID=1121393 RepID=A0A1M6EIK8_9BACT|nr:right-handed parallel beta-helix repeat-containing protein [Desulfatibacillum alkenivorans]SHI85281.1 Right handed beta helix region [Desulfatibacillum alkenivorans DSM 16219]
MPSISSPLKAIFFLFFFLIPLAGLCHGATITVPGDYAKIQDAVLAAQAGDTVEVGPGTYTFTAYEGNNAEAVAGSSNCTDPGKIIGKTNNWGDDVKIGADGYIIVRMEEEIMDGPGDDFYVHWWTSNGNSWGEYAHYYVGGSASGPWTRVTSASDAFSWYHFGDLSTAGAASARYVKIEPVLENSDWTLNVRFVEGDLKWDPPIYIPSAITLKGAGTGQTIIDGANLSPDESIGFVNVGPDPWSTVHYDDFAVIAVNATGVAISDLTVKNHGSYAGVRGSSSTWEPTNFLTISGVEVSNCYTGMSFGEGSDNLVVENCLVHDNAHGGIQCGSKNVNVNGNVFYQNADGSGNNGYGISAAWACAGRFTNNVVLSNDYGITVQSSELGAQIDVLNNTVVNNSSGILLNSCTGAVRVKRNISVNNFSGASELSCSVPPDFDYNMVHGNTRNYEGNSTGANDIRLSPVFVDKNSGDYHLQNSSPGINIAPPSTQYEYLDVGGVITDTSGTACRGAAGGMATRIPDEGPNSHFFGTYQVTETVGDCDPVTKIVEVGNDPTRVYNQNYLYIPAAGGSFQHQWTELDLDARTMSMLISDKVITITDQGVWAGYSYQGWADNYTVTFAEDYNSFTFSGALSEDGDEACVGAKSGTGVRLDGDGNNKRFYGAYMITGTEGSCDEETKFFVIGGDPGRIGYDNYLYLPASGTSFTFSGENMDGDYCQWSTSISGDSITLNNEGYAVDNPDNTWSEQITAVFAADLNSFTYSGTSQDDDADQCQGVITGSGARVAEAGPNTRFYGNYIIDETLGACTENGKVVEIGNDAKRIGAEYYIYLPAEGSDFSFSFRYDDGDDFAERQIAVASDTLTIDTVGVWVSDPSKGWTEHIAAQFSADMNSLTYTGTLADDDPAECQGAMSGTGERISTQADNSRFFGSWLLFMTEGPCSAEVKVVTFGGDASKKNVDNYIYLPPKASPVSYSGFFQTDEALYDRTLTLGANFLKMHDDIMDAGLSKTEEYTAIFHNGVPERDYDGEPRIQGGMYDAGADETDVQGSGLDLTWELALNQEMDQEGAIEYEVTGESEMQGLTLTTPLNEEFGIPFRLEENSLQERFIDGTYSVAAFGAEETGVLSGSFPGQFPEVSTRIKGDKSLFVEWTPWTAAVGSEAQIKVMLEVNHDEIYSVSLSSSATSWVAPIQDIASGLSGCVEYELIVMFTNTCGEGISKSTSRTIDMDCSQVPLGDYNADEALTLQDCLLGLEILTGKERAVSFDQDPTGNQKVEQEDLIYILRELAE